MSEINRDLKKASALDKTLIERASADAARLIGAMPKDLNPSDEPALIYKADLAS
jgi:hypothetical protein